MKEIIIGQINKMQTPEDVEKFKSISPKQLESILKDTPKSQVDLIAKVLLTFLFKINIPVREAEELVGKVREKKMAELFENMEKMDIQAERRKTRRAEKRAEKAEAKAEIAEAKAEEALRLYVSVCREFAWDDEMIAMKLREKFDLNDEFIQRLLT